MVAAECLKIFPGNIPNNIIPADLTTSIVRKYRNFFLFRSFNSNSCLLRIDKIPLEDTNVKPMITIACASVYSVYVWKKVHLIANFFFHLHVDNKYVNNLSGYHSYRGNGPEHTREFQTFLLLQQLGIRDIVDNSVFYFSLSSSRPPPPSPYFPSRDDGVEFYLFNSMLVYTYLFYMGTQPGSTVNNDR